MVNFINLFLQIVIDSQDLFCSLNIFFASVSQGDGVSRTVENGGARLVSTSLIIWLKEGWEIYSFFAAAVMLPSCMTVSIYCACLIFMKHLFYNENIIKPITKKLVVYELGL